MMRRADERFWNGACEALVRCDADEGRWRVSRCKPPFVRLSFFIDCCRES